MPLHGCGHGSFQLFRFEVIGEPEPYAVGLVRSALSSFQLFRFEVIGEPYEIARGSLDDENTEG